MKKSIMAFVVLGLFASAAYAGNDNGPNNNINNTATGLGFGGEGGTGLGFGGNGGSVNTSTDYGDLKIVPSAIAPSVSTAKDCPMVMQGSKAGSVFFASVSGTHAPEIVPICVAWHLGQKSIVEKMACNASKEYREANPACNTNSVLYSEWIKKNHSVNTNPLTK